MNFEVYLKDSAQKIDEELDLILAGFLKEAKETDKKLLPLALAFLNACKGGKRIRGTLVRLGYELASSHLIAHLPGENKVTPGAHLEGVIRVAAAYEILHASVLIHDDIIDQGPVRRGKPSLYAALGGNHYGISQAISLGDMGFFLAMKIITETAFADSEKNSALVWLNKIMIDTATGEMLDIEEGADPLTVMRLKTARYTFCGPLILGAILAGTSHLPGVKAHLEGVFLSKLGEFGESLGIAYQIKDDLLDEEYKIGDADYCQKKVLEYSAQAGRVIGEITDNSEYRSLLEGMVDYLVQRTK